MLENILEENGFTNREAKIYLAGLELGQSPASSIAKYAKENRVTVYTILKELCKKWIFIETIKNKIKYYEAISPQKLINLIQEQVFYFEKILERLNKIGGIKTIISSDINLKNKKKLHQKIWQKKQKSRSSQKNNTNPIIQQWWLFDF